ncbi:4-hydroxy-tetrahydrodipicolinate reductase [[Clostridium] colinum]|uniref:4-hydroxy-tetrahydrodipicolinate reductase n=1 Tax=[Clostridium] colinum TaxID=36835 RepID=UPI002024559D|nr:4-hydroxy-tetrahydrodipicolinate reductase [[Clostridium] colinum]
MIKIIMHGCNGKMGQAICNLVEKDNSCEIVAGVDINPINAKFPTFTDINDCNIEADVVIDFSTAIAVDRLMEYCLNKKIPVVVCTTGLNEQSINKIDEVSKHIPVFKSANMSLGINLIASLLKKASAILDENGFDIEIIEKHHNQKIDAPSGTALLLADAINESMDNKFEYIYDRSKTREKRSNKEIGISSIRGGNIVGEHSVIYAGKDEIIEFTHFAHSKEVFAIGALKAGKFLVNKPAGKYNMQDIMDSL